MKNKKVIQIVRISVLFYAALFLLSLICYANGINFNNLDENIYFLYGCGLGLSAALYTSFLSRIFFPIAKNGRLMEG
jgi:hypothetical protein